MSTLDALRAVTPADAAKWEHADLIRDVENYTKRYADPGAFDNPATDRSSDLQQTSIAAYEDCLDIREIVQAAAADTDIPCDDGRLGVLLQCADGLDGFDREAPSLDALRSDASKAYGAPLPMPSYVPADASLAWSASDLRPPSFVDDPQRKERHLVQFGELHRSVYVLIAPAGNASRVRIRYAPRPACFGPGGSSVLAADGAILRVASDGKGQRSISTPPTPEAKTSYEVATVQFVAAGTNVVIDAEFDELAPERDVQRAVVVDWANRILTGGAQQ